MDMISKVTRSDRRSLGARRVLLGVLGAILGAAAGYYVCYWFLTQGFYAIALPGVFIGLGSRLFLRKNDFRVHVFCAIFALFAGLYVEWKFFPFIKDPSLSYFFAHLQLLKPVTWILIGVGTYLAYHFAKIPSQPKKNDNPLPESQEDIISSDKKSIE